MPIVDLSDDDAEEEGLVPRRRIIREPEEERRTAFIRQFEADRVKIPLRTSELECPVPLSAADEFGFVSPEQRLKAIEEQQRLDKQKQELKQSENYARLLQEQETKRKNDESLNDYKSRLLAERLAKKDLKEQNLKMTPIQAQEKLLHSLKTRQKPKDADLEWCQKRLNLRIHEAKITNVSIQGQNSSRGLTIYTTISRGGTIEQKDQAQFLKFYGYTEWLEIREAIQRSKSRFKGDVENIINQLLQRMSRIVEVPSLPERSRKKKKAKVTEAIEDAPPTVNEHDTRFDAQSLFAHLQIPDHSMLNTSLPPSLSDFYENQIIQFPEKGMIFMDNDGYLKFFRNKEIEAAPSQMIRALHYQLWADDLPTQLQKTIFEKEMERRNEEIRVIA